MVINKYILYASLLFLIFSCTPPYPVCENNDCYIAESSAGSYDTDKSCAEFKCFLTYLIFLPQNSEIGTINYNIKLNNANLFFIECLKLANKKRSQKYKVCEV